MFPNLTYPNRYLSATLTSNHANVGMLEKKESSYNSNV